LRFDNVFAAERWEQNFQVAARLPLTEAFSLRQELRAGLQNETVLGDELTATYHDALAMLEKTAIELKTSESLRIAATVQQQWIANNSVPFAEIVTYGTEAKFKPVKTTTLTLQADWSERQEFAASQSDQENYRLSLEQELVPKVITAAAGVSLGHLEDALQSDKESFTQKVEGSLKWTPLTKTTFTLGGERSTRESESLEEAVDAYAVKLQQQLFARSKVELQAGYELHTRAPLDSDPLTTGSAWTLGANSDFALREDWNAGLGVRYRQPDDPASVAPVGELSLSLSLKGRF